MTEGKGKAGLRWRLGEIGRVLPVEQKKNIPSNIFNNAIDGAISECWRLWIRYRLPTQESSYDRIVDKWPVLSRIQLWYLALVIGVFGIGNWGIWHW